MKTIPVCLIVAGILAPVISQAQPGTGPSGPPPREGDGKRGPQRPFVEFWKFVDKNQDGFISKEEFDMMPRIQNLPEEKRLHLFKRLDKNSDGNLGRDEISRLGQHHEGHGPPMQRLWELDADKSGGVSLEEFKAGRVFNKLPPERQDQLFNRLDSDRNGLITPKDRPEPFNRDDGDQRPGRPDGGKPEGGRIEPRQIIRHLDKDGDGALSFEEFRAGPMVKDLTEDEQEDRFEAMDKNHDQKLAADDFPPPLRAEPN